MPNDTRAMSPMIRPKPGSFTFSERWRRLAALQRVEALKTHLAAAQPAALRERDREHPTFEQVYEETFPPVWRTVRRLGVADAAVDDVVQEVFVNVYRRLGQFEGRCSVKTWVFGIVVRVMGNYRRTRRRKGAGHATSSVVGDPELVVDSAADPLELASRSQASRIVRELLEKLDEDKAAVFVLAEIEGLTVPEISDATGVNVNTVYSRLRVARKDFERARKQYALRGEARSG